MKPLQFGGTNSPEVDQPQTLTLRVDFDKSIPDRVEVIIKDAIAAIEVEAGRGGLQFESTCSVKNHLSQSDSAQAFAIRGGERRVVTDDPVLLKRIIGTLREWELSSNRRFIPLKEVPERPFWMDAEGVIHEPTGEEYALMRNTYHAKDVKREGMRQVFPTRGGGRLYRGEIEVMAKDGGVWLTSVET